jgi:hypothetical protein
MQFMPIGGNPFGAALSGGFRIPSISLRVSTSFFFDRDAVKSSLSAMELKALSKGSMRIKDYAKRSIRKMGAGRPRLKIMKDNPGVALAALASRPTTSQRTRRTLQTRIMEIQTRPPSRPGTPPHTHVPYSHMLGFRRNLWNYFDPQTRSAVVGPSKKGKMLPYLHEFGGTQTLSVWVFRNRYPGGQVITRTGATGDRPRNSAMWQVTSQRRTVTYPERPFMHPAMMRAVANGDLAKAFGGQFSVAQAGRGTFIRGS